MIILILLVSLNLWSFVSKKSTDGFIHDHVTLFCGLLLTVYCGISLAMAFLPCTNFHHPVICHGTPDGKSVALTFDDGPDPIKTPLILEVLRKHDVSATFFLIGKNLAGNELLVKRLVDDGHLAGNHSFSHSGWFDLFSAGRMRSEMMETDRLVNQITGKSPLFFRPPFGVVNPMVSKALKNMHWHAICWNIRSLDTIDRDAQKTSHKILRQLQPGAIILLHDHTLFTQHHLDDLISSIKAKGYGIVPLDKLLNIPAYAL